MDYFVEDFKKCLIAIIIFLIFFVIDFIFGLCKGIFVEGISSSKLRMSVPKFVGYVGMIFMSILLDTLIVTSTDVTYAPIGLISCVCFSIIEVSSIIENAKSLGINIPPIITKTFDYIKDKVLSDKEQKGGAALKFTDWVKTYLGRKTDYDGAYGVQCVDLIDCYIDRCLGLKKGYWGNAKTWWTNRNASKWLKDNFDFITPTYRNGELQTGDIGIRTSGTYGHIFIVKEPTANGRIKYYDQNAAGNGDAMALREKPYTSAYINGILRPKNQSSLKETAVFKVGSTYTLTTNVNVRTGAGTNCAQKKKSELTADGQKHALNQMYATLKTGTRVTVNQIKYIGSDIWAQIPSGWICLKYNGKAYAK